MTFSSSKRRGAISHGSVTPILLILNLCYERLLYILAVIGTYSQSDSFQNLCLEPIKEEFIIPYFIGLKDFGNTVFMS